MSLEKRISELEATISRLRQELMTDELTKILNRRGLVQSIMPVTKEVLFQLENPERRRNVIIRNFCLILIDIDHFKRVNDTHGHLAGDQVLRKVARILRESVRGLDIVGRWGGEELMVGLVGADSRDAKNIAESLRQKISQTGIIVGDKAINVTASFGVAELKNGMTLEELTKLADEALYQAKESGRNKVVVAN